MRLAAALLISSALTPLACAQRLVCVDSSRVVSQVDITTGARTTLGTISTNASTTAGFAYDQLTGRLWVTSTGNDSLFVIDVTNWNATLVGAYGSTTLVMHGLEWDPSTSTLYGMSSHNAGLYTIDTTTGVATLVGTTGLTSFCNLVYYPPTNTMYMTNSASDSWYSIDRATGAATLIGPLAGFANPNALAFNPDNGLVYATDNNTDLLSTIDVTTGVPTTIGSLGASNVLGLAYIPSTGRLTRTVHGCGPSTITATGHPAIGYTVNTTIGGAGGFPFVGLGVTSVGLPFCGCTIGHEWAVAALGPTVPLAIPLNPVLIGISVQLQGLDFLGPGGCADPLLALTDTITLTVGN